MFRGVTLALLMMTLFCGQALAAEKYTVASDCTWPPMEMLNAQKQPEGYSTDYIRAVAKAAGFEVDVRNIAWDDPAAAVTGFVTVAFMPLTYNISYGIAFGLISYVFVKIFTGKIKEINVGTWIISILFALMFFLTR